MTKPFSAQTWISALRALVDGDAVLNRDLEDFAFLDPVDVVVVEGAEFDLVHEPFLDVVDRHVTSPAPRSFRSECE